MANGYRALSAEEIDILLLQGCDAEDFSTIEVAEGFDPSRVRATHFSGSIKIGVLEKRISFFGGVEEPAGIYHARIHNCVIGNNVYISNIENYIANYVIEDEVVIRHIGLLAVEGESSFGNGTEAKVINESGGREVPIYDYLSAQTAYLLALYRDRGRMIENLRKMIDTYTRSVSSNMGRIGRGARLIDCSTLKNIKVGPAAVIEGANRLENGTINSCPEDPTRIGTGVIAQDFIVCSGARITDNVIIDRCFIGQGTVLGRQYSAADSIFFANCGGFHGEACSIFAGPFTVTHHKSTLLISGLFSFLNAGSGSNQSNHMYKLGPVHQGVVERGSKTTSDSYLLWPAKVGPFTMVMGRHYGNCDTGDLPYSYLIEHEDESVLVPGVNLRSVGTVRDARKWPQRDKRKANDKLDLISYNLLTPFTVQKMINGVRILTELKERSGENTRFYYYNSVKIKRKSLENGIRYYNIGIQRYLGNCLVQRLRRLEFDDMETLRNGLVSQNGFGSGQWLDVAGLVTPKELVDQLLNEIENGTISRLEELKQRFGTMYDNYTAYEWAWATRVFEEYQQVNFAEVTAEEMTDLIEKWIAVVEELDQMRCRDAEKEFALPARIGFGHDGDSHARDRDFESVIGSAQEHDFILELKQRLAQKQQTARELIQKLTALS